MAERRGEDSSATAPDEMESLPMITAAVTVLVIGAGLILLGICLSAAWLRWPAIGLGAVSVLVGAGFLVARTWETVEAPVRRSVSAARGHVRTDP